MGVTAADVTMYIQLGEQLVPVVTAAYEEVQAFVASHNGNADVLAQLQANDATIGADEATVDAEIAAQPPKA